jgi:uncharacterized protein YgiM (DUF1202 family)
MPYDPSSASRTYAANAHRSHMNAHNRMARHGREAQARQLEHMRAFHRGARRGTGLDFPGDEAPAGTRPRRGRTGVVLLVLAAAAACAWLVLAPRSPVRPMVFGDHATVRAGTEWNVRRGPGMGYPPVGVVRPGQDVAVACAHGGWIKITSPTTGFVYQKGLTLSATPRPC